MANESEAPAEVCPVDHATRAAWLKSNSSRPVFPGATAAPPTPANPGCDSSTLDQNPTPPSKGLLSRFSSAPSDTPKSLGVEREVSTIPRASAVKYESQPANSEGESGVSASGNWIYPSEKMFFEAMKRKGYQSEAKDMKTIVPIHNAVNERAWKEIKEWERPYGADEKCGGPRLDSFLGLSTSMSPKARFNTLLGYAAPFDRHDWVVDRCGTKIEYVIDFYAGRNQTNADGKLSFYLDVRPKLNTLEGWKMRGSKILGLI
ncbi:cytochrome c heme lyase-1 [Coleophoma crateriformis]|uniref:Holocytochrome c-type synthase n=1 Tax=Coleophoma crateriformis TaxID=565419 RepID=A0A3D8SYU5_9HELO|nr:cytochrome c heme lyase-1 [Coleophoma crateriformis]